MRFKLESKRNGALRLYGLSFASAGFNSPLRLCLSIGLCPLLGYLARASLDSHSLPLPSRETKFALKAYSRSRRIKSCSLAGCLKPFAVRPHSGLAFRPRLTVEEPLTPTTLARSTKKHRTIFQRFRNSPTCNELKHVFVRRIL